MDLAHPLSSLIPSLDASTLGALAATEGSLSASQIARTAGRGSRTGHLLVLGRLVEHGIVLAEPTGHGSRYRLNRDHVLHAAILEALAARRTLIDRVATRSRLLDPLPVHVSLFGSFARGEATTASDVDLLVVAQDADAVEALGESLADVTDSIQRWCGNRCQIVAVSVEQLRSMAADGEPIVANLLADHVVLIGDPLDAVLTGCERTA